ncbi:TetR/AcrR family transcriptional regulator [Mycobacterium kansasii]|nr:TetR/AcrR family transcriptional regulator [Mycobacterium kansasii]EUA03596.1 bacterial regulatory s, tetR family protein [Mycobacterium kansasii 824]ARG59513.1 TetR family transcriptional regulator [Mycobacterium kansasii]ARG64980.1 TetR family transcriptional regulator [Mycobacterium kansasii]ARG72728.1 TetR family transcriptional regulator [Mycobacterium kansasii]ARG78257.1 TetR family transcriptional regulator [Mycobacterium kansasii]
MTRAQLGRPVGSSGEETRRRIIVATMRCVAEVGYSQATIREIARAADMTSASLYNYFPNKSELIKATIAARAEAAMPRLRKAAQGPGDIVERIEAVLDECGQLMREYPDLAAFEWAIRAGNIVSSDWPAAAEVGDRGFTTFREIIEGIVGDAHQRGELADPDARATVEAIYALIYGLTELAATLPPEEYQAALSSAKVLVRGALFGSTSAAHHGPSS